MPTAEALLSLQGLSTGDAFGEQFFEPNNFELIRDSRLPPGIWRWTDDTHMALSIVEVLKQYGQIDQQALIQAFTRRYHEDPHRGYGAGMHELLAKIQQEREWRAAARDLFAGGSYGNGAAMRAAPIGGYFAGDPQRAAEQARLSAEVTHAHPEGQAGAMAVAAAAALMAQPNPPTGDDLITAVLPFVPEGETRQKIEQAQGFTSGALQEAAELLGTGKNISAQDTVPFCLWLAAHTCRSFPEAMWKTVSGHGDVDTTCAIVGGLVALSAHGVPADWLRQREPLPDGFEV